MWQYIPEVLRQLHTFVLGSTSPSFGTSEVFVSVAILDAQPLTLLHLLSCVCVCVSVRVKGVLGRSPDYVETGRAHSVLALWELFCGFYLWFL